MSEKQNIATEENTQAIAAATAPAGWQAWMAALSGVLALCAWVALCFNGYTALGLGIAGFVSSILGLRAATRAWRNLATTALIASVVIIVVLTAFLIVIFWGLNSI
ncbi:MAG: hypothetical protein K2M12_08440 [Muribaculaceae bacterium]|nr:hypothetical protein [Muribaculaceae bacterium]